MKTARSDLVIMPNSEQAEHPSREGAMNSQMRPDNALPIFHGTTGTHSLIPGSQRARGDCSPSGANTLQQVLARWTKYGPTQPSPRQQGGRLRSQASAGLLVDRIQSSRKQQGLRQSQTNLLCKQLKLPLHCRRGSWHQLIQQIQHGDDLTVTVFTTEQAIRQRHDHLQQRVQFLTQIAHCISDIAHLGKAHLLLSQSCFGPPSSSSSHVCQRMGLPLDGEHTRLFCLHSSIQTPLDLIGHMEEMPDISLVLLLPLTLTQGFLDGSASITDRAQTADALLLQIPQQQRPAFSIDLHRGHGGPHLPAVDINDIEGRFSTLTTVLFVQSQSTPRLRLLLLHPLLGTLPCFFDNASNGTQADLNPMIAFQSGLNASITGVRFQQQVQDQHGNRRGLFHRQDLRFQCLFQPLPSHGFPTLTRLTRDLIGATQLHDQPVGRPRQQLTDHAYALLNRATMVHVSSLRWVIFLSVSPYLSGILFVNFLTNCHIGSGSL